MIHSQLLSKVCAYIYLKFFASLFKCLQDVGFQHGKLVFTGWARGDIIENMLKDHRSADYNDSKRTDVNYTHHKLYLIRMMCN